MYENVQVGESLRLDIERGSELEARLKEIKATLGIKSNAEVVRFLIMNFPLELYKNFPSILVKLLEREEKSLRGSMPDDFNLPELR